MIVFSSFQLLEEEKRKNEDEFYIFFSFFLYNFIKIKYNKQQIKFKREREN